MVEPLSPTSALLVSSAVPSTLFLAYAILVPIVLSLNGVSSLCSTHLLAYLVASYGASHLFLLFSFSVALHPLPLCHAFHQWESKVLSLVALTTLHLGALVYAILFLVLPGFFSSIISLSFAPAIDTACAASTPFRVALAGVGVEAAFVLWAVLTWIAAQCTVSLWKRDPARCSLESERLLAAIAEASVRHQQWAMQDDPVDAVKAPPAAAAETGRATDTVKPEPHPTVHASASADADEDEILRFTERRQEERRRQRDSASLPRSTERSLTRGGHASSSGKATDSAEEKVAESPIGAASRRPSSILPSQVSHRTAHAAHVREAKEEPHGDSEHDEEDSEEDDDEDEDDIDEESDEEEDGAELLPLPLSARTIPLLPPLPARSAARGSAPPLQPACPSSHPPNSSAPVAAADNASEKTREERSSAAEAVSVTLASTDQPSSAAVVQREQDSAVATPGLSAGHSAAQKEAKPSASTEEADGGEAVTVGTPRRSGEGSGEAEDGRPPVDARRKSLVTARSGRSGRGVPALLPIVAMPGGRRKAQLTPLPDATRAMAPALPPPVNADPTLSSPSPQQSSSPASRLHGTSPRSPSTVVDRYELSTAPSAGTPHESPSPAVSSPHVADAAEFIPASHLASPTAAHQQTSAVLAVGGDATGDEPSANLAAHAHLAQAEAADSWEDDIASSAAAGPHAHDRRAAGTPQSFTHTFDVHHEDAEAVVDSPAGDSHVDDASTRPLDGRAQEAVSTHSERNAEANAASPVASHPPSPAAAVSPFEERSPEATRPSSPASSERSPRFVAAAQPKLARPGPATPPAQHAASEWPVAPARPIRRSERQQPSEDWEAQLERDAHEHEHVVDSAHQRRAPAHLASPAGSEAGSRRHSSIIKAPVLLERSDAEQRLIHELRHEQTRRYSTATASSDIHATASGDDAAHSHERHDSQAVEEEVEFSEEQSGSPRAPHAEENVHVERQHKRNASQRSTSAAGDQGAEPFAL